MSSEAVHAAAPSSGHGTFLRARAGSFLAVLPLGVWTIIHLWNNLAAYEGSLQWQREVTKYPQPAAHVATLVIVLVPLLLHTAWGISRMTKSRPNNTRYGYLANLRYILQRASAVGLMLFLGAHLWLAMLKPRLVDGHAETFAAISHEMRTHAPTQIVYALGILGIAYHLANGVSGFAMGWGVIQSKQALRKLDVFVWALFVALLVLGYGAMYGVYRAGH